MPRIVPIQLLTCLKVLLDENGGILSAGEVKRLASLMTKYSKKLVSKCIYVQILKSTKTELLGEFMGAGGWSLVYTWLNDAIRAQNWPLVEEILELWLLCPVDIYRLKINSAPKLVKGLSRDGGNKGVCILANRLVDQWLEIVTEKDKQDKKEKEEKERAEREKAEKEREKEDKDKAKDESIKTETTTGTTSLPSSVATMTPQQTSVLKTPPVAVVAPLVTPVNTQQTSVTVAQPTTTTLHNKKSQQNEKAEPKATPAAATKEKEKENERDHEDEGDDDCEMVEEKDPLGDVEETITADPFSYGLTPAQKKASESGLVYKIVVKNGNQFLAKVPKQPEGDDSQSNGNEEGEEDDEEADAEDIAEQNNVEEDEKDVTDNANAVPEADDSSLSEDKPENDSNSSNEDDTKVKTKQEEVKKSEGRKSSTEEKEKTLTSEKSNKLSKDKERRSSSNGLEKEKDKDRDKDKDKDGKTSKSSSSHRSSSHKSSSSSSKSSSSSSSKSKSSSSSSSRRSSSDKHKSDKDRSSSSSKDKDRSGSSTSSSSSKHRSSSSKTSSSSSSSSSKDKYRDRDKSGSSSSTSSKNKDRENGDKNKANVLLTSSSSNDKLPKIPTKSKEENDTETVTKPISITIPSKKASMSIEIRKDTEKAKTVKTYKSQFRSHGLTEEAPPPPSRKGLKKPPSTPSSGSILPMSLPSSLKRTSPPPRDSPSEKKAKIDVNNVTVANEKPGAIKLIPPKKIQTLVETNIFSDALSAATGPKKVSKRKRPNTPSVPGSGKEAGALSPPISPAVDVPKITPLKFYQDTLDESKTEDSKSDKDENSPNKMPSSEENTDAADKVNNNSVDDDEDDDDDDDIPLKKVKEDIEQKVAREKKLTEEADVTVIEDDDDKNETPGGSPKEDMDVIITDAPEVKKPGPGCGPNGPPGVLMLHRRKGPKKKLTWKPQESLEQVRYFELDENERCNVTKTSFMDMKNLERSNERDAVVLARRGFNQEDNMEPTTNWRKLIEVDDVPPHPDGNQSKQRKIQAEREMSTLRALYFTHALIPDSPAEAEIEPVFNQDIPLIPLDDLTGNPDAVNVFTTMPWPEPKGSPKYGEAISMAGSGGLGSPVDIFGGGPSPQMMPSPKNNNNNASVIGRVDSPPSTPFMPFISPFGSKEGLPNGPAVGIVIPNRQPNNWQRGTGPNAMGGNGPMMGNQFTGNNGSPIMDILGGNGGPRSMGNANGGGPKIGPMHMMNNGPQQNFNNQNFNNQFSPNNNHFGPPINAFGNGPNNFGPMGPGGPMISPHMMNGMGPGPMMGNNGSSMMNVMNNNNRNNGGGGNWRSGGGPNFQDNNCGGGGGGGGNWRPAGTGRCGNGGGGGGNNNSNNNNGICKAFMRGHCRVGKSCKYIHPSKSKRI